MEFVFVMSKYPCVLFCAGGSIYGLHKISLTVYYTDLDLYAGLQS